MNAPPIVRPLRALIQRRLLLVPSRPIRSPLTLQVSQSRRYASKPSDRDPKSEPQSTQGPSNASPKAPHPEAPPEPEAPAHDSYDFMMDAFADAVSGEHKPEKISAKTSVKPIQEGALNAVDAAVETAQEVEETLKTPPEPAAPANDNYSFMMDAFAEAVSGEHNPAKTSAKPIPEGASKAVEGAVKEAEDTSPFLATTTIDDAMKAIEGAQRTASEVEDMVGKVEEKRTPSSTTASLIDEAVMAIEGAEKTVEEAEQTLQAVKLAPGKEAEKKLDEAGKTSMAAPAQSEAKKAKKPNRLPRNVAAFYLAPLRRQAEYGVPSCDLQLRSYSLRPLEFFCDFALRAAYYLGLPAYGPVPLPKIIERWTVPRSSFIFKKSQENFERITRRRLLQIKDGHPETVQIWLAFLKKHQHWGVGMKANMWEYSTLDVGKELSGSIKVAERAIDPKMELLGQTREMGTVEKVGEILTLDRYKLAGGR